MLCKARMLNLLDKRSFPDRRVTNYNYFYEVLSWWTACLPLKANWWRRLFELINWSFVHFSFIEYTDRNLADYVS